MRNCVSGLAKACEKLLLPKCIRRQAILSPGFIVDEVSTHVRLLLISHRQGLGNVLGIAHDTHCSGSNSSSQEMNPTLQRQLPLHADC